ncbi:MAG: protease inhibitor I9 family protein, partial [Caldilineaceae bacterium]|nr:protease inhibitor I9 family protein [Caldilineaceae bacterium]
MFLNQRLLRVVITASFVLSAIFPPVVLPFANHITNGGSIVQAASPAAAAAMDDASPPNPKRADAVRQNNGVRTTALRGSTAGKFGLRNQYTAPPRARTVHYEVQYANALADSAVATQPAVYIVLLADAPVATYRGGIANLAATSPVATNTRRLDLRSAAVTAYRNHLANARSAFRSRADAAVGRSIRVLHEYDTVLNGFAMQLTPAEAAKLLDLPEVQSIQRDQWRYAQTNDSPAFLGVPGIWDGSATAGLPGTKGEGIIVGVIDTGIWPEHPSFADDGSFPAPPARWVGGCSAPADGSQPYSCNNKLIG